MKLEKVVEVDLAGCLVNLQGVILVADLPIPAAVADQTRSQAELSCSLLLYLPFLLPLAAILPE